MSQILAGEIFAKKYRLEERLGEGKFKETWKATDLIMSREVALKIFKEQNTSIDRIINEATLQAKLGKHENIAEIYDAAIDSETSKAYISEEYVMGCTLAKALEKQGRIKNENLIRIAQQILNGLIYAHKRRVIHRDLKADNIFIQTKEGQEPKIVLTDWGGSTESGTSTGLHGSILVRPPEAFDGKIDEKTDMYGLGALLYKLATGVYPFEGSSYAEIEQKIRIQEPPNINSHPEADIKPDFAALIMKMLSKDPKARPNTKQAKRKIWLNKHNGEISIASIVIPAIISGLVIAAIGYFWNKEYSEEDALLYLSQTNLKAAIAKYKSDKTILRNITAYTAYKDETIFATTKKDILAYSIKNKKLSTPEFRPEDLTAIRLTKTPDKEETDLKASPSGNLLAFRIGNDLYAIGTEGRFERKVLESIDEYIWYPLKDQITYRKGNEIFITDPQECPFAEKNAKKIAEGTCPRWYHNGTTLFYLRDWNEKKWVWFRLYYHSDYIGLPKNFPDNGMNVENTSEFGISNNDLWLAYFTPGDKMLNIIDLDNNQRMGFDTRQLQNIKELTFSPDSRQITFSGQLEGAKGYDIFIFDLYKQKLHQVTRSNTGNSAPIFIPRKSPD